MKMPRYRPYAEYKDSGVEWLGEIPARWGVKRLRFVSESNPLPSEVRGLPGTTEVSFVPMEAVGERGGLSLETTKLLADVKAGYTYFRDADVVIAKITPCFENGKGALAAGLTNGIAFGTTELHVLRASRNLDNEFAFYVTLSDGFRRIGEADMYGAGGQKRISESFVRNFRLALPSLDEQRAIATFLDRETARIDELVAKKERLVTLLQERRTALITRAVTKGLDLAAPMKDSAVEWLGEIPAHWEVKRLKLLLESPLKYGANEPAELDDPELPRYIRITDIDENDRLRDETFKSLPTDVAGPYLLREGDVLFARSGATAGKSFLYRTSWGTCAYAGYLIRARLRMNEVSPYYLRYFTASTCYWNWLSATFIQATIQNVSADKYANLVVPQPPMDEQRSLTSFLDRNSTEINALIARIRDAITHLNELRTALISAAVTGKIDVREATQ
ncbi:hypothetical protein BH09GEM1_BH09GEM1_24370 [soil metagenome]